MIPSSIRNVKGDMLEEVGKALTVTVRIGHHYISRTKLYEELVYKLEWRI